MVTRAQEAGGEDSAVAALMESGLVDELREISILKTAQDKQFPIAKAVGECTRFTAPS